MIIQLTIYNLKVILTFESDASLTYYRVNLSKKFVHLRGRFRERRIEKSFIHWFTLQMAINARAELIQPGASGLPCGYRLPGAWAILAGFPGHTQGLDSKWSSQDSKTSPALQ